MGLAKTDKPALQLFSAAKGVQRSWNLLVNLVLYLFIEFKNPMCLVGGVFFFCLNIEEVAVGKAGLSPEMRSQQGSELRAAGCAVLAKLSLHRWNITNREHCTCLDRHI